MSRMQDDDPAAREIQFCPYCGARGTVEGARIGNIEVFDDDGDFEAHEGSEAVERLGTQEQECKACETRFFSI